MTKPPKNVNQVVLKILAFVMATKNHGATADECLSALKMPEGHATVSARFHELVQAGCLAPTKQKRATKTGKPAQVFVHRKGYGYGHYQHYMRTKQRKTRKVHGITPFEQQVLDAGMHFIKSLPGKGSLARQRLLTEHVQTLAKLSRQYQQEAAKAKTAAATPDAPRDQRPATRA